MPDNRERLVELADRKRRVGESPLEYARRIYRPLVSVDEIAGIEREGRARSQQRED